MKRLVVGTVLLLVAGCGAGAATIGSSVPVSTPSVPRTERWNGFETRQITLNGTPLFVAVASTRDERTRGLSGVSDLDGIDGMLFFFEGSSTAKFWMKDTLIDLDIAFFDTLGRLLTVRTMPVCTEDPCPTYGSTGPYRWALEAPAGRALADVAPGSLLVP
ncbi:hypothetical protein BMS3Abin02_01951 [bacterium BMS3Abin02]|nr:hypothetical protein BMS3Abin02_01951 [bacterium BMS3Abin02]GBE21156.1 hypothetical protein BMS3Bbin01_00497 [bacterium BMS3Bbin01]HDH25040.1 DUF192 domain-containing protein [Actinomycetota bacterium]HDK44972.1 DUF192 domain-containing protein [Actinomycetota bacterium]HDL49435.1 DUF192 domain-containing protein [Actinomycetota bacterium]